jgi:hypothetical protein
MRKDEGGGMKGKKKEWNEASNDRFQFEPKRKLRSPNVRGTALRRVFKSPAGSLTSAYRVVNATSKDAESDSNPVPLLRDQVESVIKKRNFPGQG